MEELKNLDLFGGDTRVIKPSKCDPAWRIFRTRNHYRKGAKPSRCKDCKQLHVNSYSKNYYKCQLQGVTGNPATDIRVGNTCDKWEPQF